MTDSIDWMRDLLKLAESSTGSRATAAQDPLPDGLARLDPITAAPDPDVIAAAIVYARHRNAEPELQLVWARHAKTAAEALWGLQHPATRRVARVYHDVLVRQGLTFDAVRICEDELAIRKLGDPVRELAARCALALALHRDGQCDTAEQQIRRALRQWWASPHGYGNASKVLFGAAAIDAGCGRTTSSVKLLTDDAAHLAYLDTSHRDLAAMWLATVTRQHPTGCSLSRTDSPPNRSHSCPDQKAFWLRVLQSALSRHPGSAADVAQGRAAP